MSKNVISPLRITQLTPTYVSVFRVFSTHALHTVPLMYSCICERMGAYEHTLTSAVIRCSVTALKGVKISRFMKFTKRLLIRLVKYILVTLKALLFNKKI